MELALRLAVALFVTTAPTVLFLGLMRGLQLLRDDATLASVAAREDLPPEVRNEIRADVMRTASRERAAGNADASNAGESNAETSNVETSNATTPKGVTDAAVGLLESRPIRSEQSGDDSDRVSCPTCGESNMARSSYCGACLGELTDV